MGEVIKIKAMKRARADAKVLCSSGFHKWQTLTQRTFDVKQGKLVSAEKCTRCGVTRVKLR
jgi:hypothetical protein